MANKKLASEKSPLPPKPKTEKPKASSADAKPGVGKGGKTDEKQKRRSEYEILIDDLNIYKKDGLLDNPSPSFMERLMGRINESLRRVIKRQYAKQCQTFARIFRRGYYDSKKELPERHGGIRAYKLKELDSEFQRAYKTRMESSLALIKSNNAELLAKLQKRFIDWTTMADVRTKAELEEAVALPKDKKTQFIARDQAHKMRAAMDDIIADRYEAIAFQWKTRNDNRVAGKPSGLYPKPDKDSPMHGDHWERKDKFYYIEGLPPEIRNRLKLSEFEGSDKSFKDGMPGTPIGCRCYAKYFYFVEDLPGKLVKDKWGK